MEEVWIQAVAGEGQQLQLSSTKPDPFSLWPSIQMWVQDQVFYSIFTSATSLDGEGRWKPWRNLMIYWLARWTLAFLHEQGNNPELELRLGAWGRFPYNWNTKAKAQARVNTVLRPNHMNAKWVTGGHRAKCEPNVWAERMSQASHGSSVP